MSQLNETTKQALRLAAVGALLHNLGKISNRFLDKQIHNPSSDYLYQHILGLITSHATKAKIPSDWHDKYDVVSNSAILDPKTVGALKTNFKLPSPLDDRADYTVGDLIEYLGQGEPWYKKINGQYGIELIFPKGSRLTHLMNRAHRGASGGEKEDIATAQQPNAKNLYLSTPFGYETPAPNLNTINDLLQKIEATIQKYLTSPAHPFPLADFVSELRPLLSQALADTRRPLNDVTVGDIGHTGMAFLLTQAVEWILTNRPINHDELAKTEKDNTLFWRVLTVHTDSLRYLEGAASLADLRVRQQQLQETFQTLSRQLEETLLAVEIYADEQRRLFIVPNLDETTNIQQSLKEIISRFHIDGLRLTSHLSGPVTNHPDDNAHPYIGDEVLKQILAPCPYNFDANIIASIWKNSPNKVRCSACNLRPQGYGAEEIDTYKHNPAYYREKAESRNICCVCMHRRTGVAEKWATEELNRTVWLDEVADNNGRLALIVGQWKLEDFIRSHFYPHADRSKSKTMWLHTVKFLNTPPSDNHTFTIRGQTYTWQAGQSVLSGEQKLAPLKQTNLTIHAPSSMDITVKDVTVAGRQLILTVEEDLTKQFAVGAMVKCWGQDFLVTDTHLLKTVNEEGKQKILSHVLWDSNYPFIVQKATKVNVLEITSHGEGAKNPSFARLRRIWETTRRFWEEVLKKEAKIIGTRPRIFLKGTPSHPADLAPYHAYELEIRDRKVAVLWVPPNATDAKGNPFPYRGGFWVIENLEYLDKEYGKPFRQILGELRREKDSLQVYEPTEYGRPGEPQTTFTLSEIIEPEDAHYTPLIPILAEPRTFMALVPADKAFEVLKAIKAKYEREMGKVRNRLPLHLGIVFADAHQPLRTILDAGRRMLSYPGGKQEGWTVKGVQCVTTDDIPDELTQGTKQFDGTISVTLEREGRTITWYVPAVMGDGQTEDLWYPYVFWKQDSDGNTDPGQATRKRHRYYQAPNPFDPDHNGKPRPGWLVHAGELQEGDQVFFTPATFDFLWLDHGGRRFEIAYDEEGHRRGTLHRPYLLDEIVEMETCWKLLAGTPGTPGTPGISRLRTRQLHLVRDLIETKRAQWFPEDPHRSLTDETFRAFCESVLRNAEWITKPKEEEFKRLIQWAVNGLLADTVELFYHVMKRRPVRDEKGSSPDEEGVSKSEKSAPTGGQK